MATPQKLLDAVIRNQVYLERLKTGEVNQFAAFLKEIDKGLRERLSGGKELTEYSRQRIETLLVTVDGMLGEIFANYYDELAGHLLELADYEAENEAKIITGVSEQPNFEMVIPAPAQVRAAVMSHPLSVRGPDGGKLLEPFIKDWTHTEQKAITGAIRQGFFEGQTNAQIIQRIRGTKANKFTDGLLATTSRHADAIVRTAVQHTASVARMVTLKANADVCKGYQWSSTLDGRTSAPCRSLDGQVFEFGKGPVPPIHIRCRSSMLPALSDEFAWLTEGETRASAQGPVDAKQTYYEWLKTQGHDFQDDVLGKTKGKIFRDGGISPEKFASLSMDKNFEPLTLAELRKLEPAAFQKALSDVPLTKQAQKAKVAESAQTVALREWMTEHDYRVSLGEVENPRIKKQADQYGLTQAERVILRHYTGTGYEPINATLWGNPHKKEWGSKEQVQNAAEILRSALNKLPDHEGTVVRRDNMNAEFLAQHRPGRTVKYKAFTSATFGSKDVFAGRPQRLVIESKKCKQIDWISKYEKTEVETLFTSPTDFEVTDRFEVGKETHIYMREIE